MNKGTGQEAVAILQETDGLVVAGKIYISMQTLQISLDKLETLDVESEKEVSIMSHRFIS